MMRTILISTILFVVLCSNGFAQTVEERIKVLEEAIKKQEQTIKEQQKLIEELKSEMTRSKPSAQQEPNQSKEAVYRPGEEAPKTTTLGRVKEALLAKEGAPKKDILSYQAGGTTLRLVDVSLDGLIASGASTVRDDPLQVLQGGGHDPRKRGFTVQNVELFSWEPLTLI
jgi:hypothetical protein